MQLKFWMLFVAALDFAVAGLVALALKQRALPLTSIGGLLAIGVFIAGGLVRVVAGALIHLNPDGRGGYALASGAMCVESFVGIALSGEALSSLPYAIPLANFYFTLLCLWKLLVKSERWRIRESPSQLRRHGDRGD